MRANCILPEIEIAGGAILKNAYLRPGRSVKDPINKTYQITFDLCTEKDIDGVMTEIVNRSCTIHINKNERDAMIMVDGVEIPLIGHLQAGGVFVMEDVTDFGQPSYDDLPNWFEDSFGLLQLVESPLKWFAEIWTLQHVVFYGAAANGNFQFVE